MHTTIALPIKKPYQLNPPQPLAPIKKLFIALIVLLYNAAKPFVNQSNEIALT
jgi:hypothetical protein